MKNRFKHKAAWWLRKIADYLEPRPVIHSLKEKYGILPICMIIDTQADWPSSSHYIAESKARKQITDAAGRHIEVERNQPGLFGNYRTRLELKILVPNADE